MNEAFLRAYERELALLYERGKEFAEEYPGIAGRLGGLLQGNLDPAVDGLMQGTAFLAARAQVQIDNEFGTFTTELLDQLLPNFLAPAPSAVLVRAAVDANRPPPPKGAHFKPGAYMDARYIERDRRIQCRFRLSAPLEIWPIEISDAAYFTGPGRFQAQGLDPLPDTNAGLQIDFRRLGEASATMAQLPIDRLNVHFTTLERSDAAALFEVVMAQRLRASIRYEDQSGDPVILPLDPSQIQPVGLEEDEAFFPEDTRIFRGFTLIREYFMFPQKFQGFRITGLRPYLEGNTTGRMQLLIETDTTNAALAARVKPTDFSLFCVPAVNLFEDSANQVSLDVRSHEYTLIPTGVPSHHYEIHRVTGVSASYPASDTKVPVHRLYGAPPEEQHPNEALYYTTRRRPRVLTANERRGSRRNDYRGTEMLLSFFEPGSLDEDPASSLTVHTLTSNRHLPMQLPLGQSETDFYLNDDTSIELTRVAGPSPPRPSIAEAQLADHIDAPVPWRLISFLSLNFLGLDNRSSGGGARGLREMLSIFVDLDSPVNVQQLQGIEKIETRAIMRSIRRGNRFHPTRGIEVTLTFDERAFESESVVIFGAVLDRFLAEYAPVNSFTQTVLVSKQRGRLKTWAPRSGKGPLL